MYSFFLQLVMMLSLGIMVYLAARALPRVGERVVPSSPAKYMDRLIKKMPLEKLDAVASSVAEKVLRKAKIGILKVDNRITASLNKFKKNGTNKEPAKTELFETDSSGKDQQNG